MPRISGPLQPPSSLLGLAAALADVARSSQAEGGVEEVLDTVVTHAVTILPGARRASVSLVGPKRVLGTAAHSDDLISMVDRTQCSLGQGPTIDAAFRHAPFRTANLGADPRWPVFGPLVVRLGVRSMLSCPLVVAGQCLGVLSLASHRTAAFDEDAERLSSLFATSAAAALGTSRRDRQFREALSSRDVIGQAKGILMQRHRVSAGEAFAKLVSTSQDTNLPLREVARYVVEHVERTSAKTRPTRQQARAVESTAHAARSAVS